MKEIIKYQAYDGAEFDSEHKCLQHEAESREIDAIVGQLPPRPDLPGCRFENGGGYLQHDPDTFRKVRRELLEFGKRQFDHQWFDQALADETTHPSWVARLVGEGRSKKLADAWYRISCIDVEFREWGQPYYRDHSEQADQIRLNPI